MKLRGLLIAFPRETPTVDQRSEGQKEEEGRAEEGRQANRALIAFKSLVLSALVAIILYGMLNRGLFGPERWLPVAAVLCTLFVALFFTSYFAGVTRPVWVLVGLLAALVAVKGLSLTWSISPTETAQELLRSSMYLSAFALAGASLSSRRLVGPFVDGMCLVAGAVAGYGLLQKTNPLEYPPTSPDGVRIGSVVEYANTAAVILGMGAVLGLGRMAQLRNPMVRGLYAVLVLVFGVVLYFTFSRGGMLSLGVGLVALFALSERRAQMFANLALVAAPLVWLVWASQSFETFFRFVSEESLRTADGLAFQRELLVAVVAAFLLQAVYAALIERYELVPVVSRALDIILVVALFAGAGALGYTVVGEQRGPDAALEAATRKVESTGDVSDRLTSPSSNSRLGIWHVAWEEWKERPLTGTGAGTFRYSWLENRPPFGGYVKQVHNVYLEQGTETGVVAFLALMGFAFVLVGYAARAAWRTIGDSKVLLACLTGAVVVYLVSSALEWHWYIPPSTLYFFTLAGVTVTFAALTLRSSSEEVPG